jgi:alkylation response protein AidB-like acyl-CoA dehydrogenase
MRTLPHRYAPGDLAARFDARLAEGGGGGPFAAARLAALDRAEEFPSDACAWLDHLRLPSYYVPARHGGGLRSHEQLLLLWRAVARRDVTVAVAHAKTYLGAVCVWLAGRPDQAARLAGQILDGATVSWGLTERDHGSDLLAGEVTAQSTATGWRLRGEKWLINNATRGDLIAVLARTEPAGGARGFSVLLVDKRALAPDTFRYAEKVRTHGVRGADISGITFHDAEVPADAIVGEPGQGAEIVLKALQLTRTVSVGLSVGAAEHALRLGLGFALDRELYGYRLTDLRRVRRVLGRAATAVLLAEVASLVAARSAHALTAEMSVISAVTKSYVPTLVDRMVADIGELLGARAFLVDVYADGAFQKLERDHRIIGIFDGSTVVNQNAVINQFPRLAKAYAGRRWDEAGVRAATTLLADVPDLAPAALSLVSTGGCGIVQSLPDAVARLGAQCARGALPASVARLAERVLAVVDGVHQELAGHRPSHRDVSRAAFVSARRYELCFAAAACIQVWLNNHDWISATPHPLWTDGRWLAACLAHVLGELAEPVEADAAAFDALFDELPAPDDLAAGFSLLPHHTEPA